jgi:hypothetical protein
MEIAHSFEILPAEEGKLHLQSDPKAFAAK